MAIVKKKKLGAAGAKRPDLKPKRLLTPIFAVSFPQLFTAKKDNKGKDKFSATAIWTPAKFSATDKGLWVALKAEIDRVAMDTFGVPRLKLPRNIHRGLRNGNEKEGIAGYGEGTYFSNMTSQVPPGVIDINKAIISPEEGNTSEIFPGCYCRARVNVWSYDTKDKETGATYKGVGLGLFNLQKIKDGPRLDNRVAAEDDFDEDVDAEWLDDADEDGEDEDFG